MNEQLKTILSELRRRFEALYGERLVRMVLFGSQAGCLAHISQRSAWIDKSTSGKRIDLPLLRERVKYMLEELSAK
ncbi:MAG TPA: hypothetical protein VJ793_18380 [Anaerolineae bacterium]|nr:hypothetical protein [Anaerolineae bacterium]